MDPINLWFTTTAGIAAASIFIINVMKRFLLNVMFVKSIPTWLMVVFVAAILTYFANVQWHTLPGDSWFQLAMQSVITAGLASGFWEWMGNSTVTLRETAIRSGVNPQE